MTITGASSNPASGISTDKTSATNSLTGTGTSLPSQVLNQSDFLKLLTTQLTYQDPMNPTTDTQYISQMASFTSLQEMQTLTTDFEKYSSAQQISSSQQLLGKTVTVGPTGAQVTGVVSEVQNQSGVARLIVNGGSYDPTTVTSVTPATTTATSGQ